MASTRHGGTRGDQHRKGISPWGELYADLLKAERLHNGHSPQQHKENTRLRAGQAVDLLDAAHAANQERRDRVLRHPDLAEQIRQVLGLTEANRWNGYVPPVEVPGPARWTYYVMNTSPVRAALVSICREAYLRENAQDEGKRDAS